MLGARKGEGRSVVESQTVRTVICPECGRLVRVGEVCSHQRAPRRKAGMSRADKIVLVISVSAVVAMLVLEYGFHISYSDIVEWAWRPLTQLGQSLH
jgi:hypothetical protein